MQCSNCGAVVRPSAHFCNHCGMRQERPSVPVPEEQTAIAPAMSTSQRNMESSATSIPGRVQRPPRVPRSLETVAMGESPFADVRPSESSGRALGEIADAETMEYDSLPSRNGGARTVPLPGRGMPELEASPDDGLPWPLPPSLIVGGRYRVESLLSTGPAEPGAENSYLVSDLQGYEQCWACHATHGAKAATKRLCPECGSDMLDHDYLLRERLIPPAESKAAEVATSTAGGHAFIWGQRSYSVSARADSDRAADLPPFPHGVHLLAAVASDPGRERPGEPNEDSQGLLVLSLVADSRAEPLALGIVADGLGGHDDGHQASQLAVRVLTRSILRTLVVPQAAGDGAPLDAGAVERALRAAVREANDALCAMNDARRTDGGSTVVAALVVGETAYIANVGDSRAYLLEREGLRRITIDHSFVEQLVANGTISDDERYDHPNRNQIMRSLGEPGTEMDIFTRTLKPGMRLLLCSDGLWEMVRDGELARILAETPHPQAACDALIRAANEHGGEDNISALVIEARA